MSVSNITSKLELHTNGMVFVKGQSRMDSRPFIFTCSIPCNTNNQQHAILRPAKAELTILGTIDASSSKSHLPSQSKSISSLMPSSSVLCTSTFENLMGVGPKSSLTKRRFARGPGSIWSSMGSTTSLMILPPATLMLGHSWATMSLRNPRESQRDNSRRHERLGRGE